MIVVMLSGTASTINADEYFIHPSVKIHNKASSGVGVTSCITSI